MQINAPARGNAFVRTFEPGNIVGLYKFLISRGIWVGIPMIALGYASRGIYQVTRKGSLKLPGQLGLYTSGTLTTAVVPNVADAELDMPPMWLRDP